MRTHPPIFTHLAGGRDPYGAVCQLARRIAHQEDDGAVLTRIDALLVRGRLPRFNNYQPDERDCS